MPRGIKAIAMNLQYLENFRWVEDKRLSTTRLIWLVKTLSMVKVCAATPYVCNWNTNSDFF
jgi:hypothetical protein